VPAYHFIDQLERIATVLDGFVEGRNRRTEQSHQLANGLDAVLIAPLFAPLGTREHAADQTVEHLDRVIGEPGFQVDDGCRQRCPAAVEAIVGKQKGRGHASFANKLGEAEFGDRRADSGVDANSTHKPQPLQEAIDVRCIWRFIVGPQPSQGCHPEIGIVDEQVVEVRDLVGIQRLNERGGRRSARASTPGKTGPLQRVRCRQDKAPVLEPFEQCTNDGFAAVRVARGSFCQFQCEGMSKRRKGRSPR
jgi:hypothetical protein